MRNVTLCAILVLLAGSVPLDQASAQTSANTSAKPAPVGDVQAEPAKAPNNALPEAQSGAPGAPRDEPRRGGDGGPSSVDQVVPSAPEVDRHAGGRPFVRPVDLVPKLRSVTDAVLNAYAISGNLHGAQARGDRLRAEIAGARARRLPEIEGFARGGAQLTTENSDTVSLSRSEAGVSLSWVYRFGAADLRLQEAKARARAGEADLEAIIEEITYSTITAYYDVLLQRDVVRASRYGLEQTEIFARRIAPAIGGGGLLPESARSEIDARLARKRVELTQATEILRLAESSLAAVTGIEAGDLVDPRLYGRPFVNRKHAISVAIQTSPSVRGAREQLAAAAKARRAVARENLGSFSVDLEAAMGRNVGGSLDAEVDGSALATFRFPIFDGGLRQALEAQVAADVSAAGGSATQAQLDVERAVRAAWEVYELASNKRKDQQAEIAALAELLARYEAEVDIGQRQLGEYYAQVDAYAAAHARLAAFYYGEQLAVTQLYRGTGQIFEVLGLVEEKARLMRAMMSSPGLLAPWTEWLVNLAVGRR